MDFGDISRQADLWPYQQVAAVIAADIRSGKLAPGKRLPSQEHLAQMAGVSKSVVQNALAILQDEGLVYAVPRLGVFVAPLRDLRGLKPPHLGQDLLRSADEHPYARNGTACLYHALEERVRGHLAPELGGELGGGQGNTGRFHRSKVTRTCRFATESAKAAQAPYGTLPPSLPPWITVRESDRRGADLPAARRCSYVRTRRLRQSATARRTLPALGCPLALTARVLDPESSAALGFRQRQGRAGAAG